MDRPIAIPSPERGGHPVVRLWRERAVSLPGPPRIVSLVPSLTELLCDLGLASYLVGRTSFCIHPAPALVSVPRVGGTKTPKIDRIIELEPTHVLVNVDENERAAVERLSQAIPQVVVTHPIEVDDHFDLFTQIGQIFGRERDAQRLCTALAQALDRNMGRRYDAIPVLYYIWKDPWMTVGPDTFIARMLARVGLINMTLNHAQRGPRYPEWPIDCIGREPIAAVLLSSEPCRFVAADRRRVLQQLSPPWACAPVLGIDGEMCSWFGSRVIRGLDYLGAYRDRLDRRIARRRASEDPYA